MNRTRWFLSASLISLLLISIAMAQQTNPAPSSVVVPRLVNYSGKLTDGQGKPISGITSATFAIYKEQYEGAALWMETQNIHPDQEGKYTVQLGATKSEGLPLELFTSPEARWLGVRFSDGEEQPRVLLVSVPYALKAADADTLGGKPFSAFQLAPSASGGTSSTGAQAAVGDQANELVCSTATACKTGFIPQFSTTGGSAKLTDSLISQSGTTLTISGSDTITGNESVSGSLSAGSVIGSLGVSGFSASSADAVVGANTGGGIAVYGESTVAGGSPAIWGENFATSGGIADGVHGVAHSPGSSGVAGVNVGFGGVGVYGAGDASSGTGVFGTGITGGSFTTGTNGTALFTTAGDAVALDVSNNGASNYTMRLFNTVVGATALYVEGYFRNSGNIGAVYTINSYGDYMSTGLKSAVVPVDNDSRKVAVYTIESPETWFEDASSAQLSNGEAVVNLEPVFGQTVNTDFEYHVFLTPNGESKGLYVAQKSPTSFVVREQGGGTSNISFDYRIMAKRKGFEKLRLEDKTAEWAKLAETSKRQREHLAAHTQSPR